MSKNKCPSELLVMKDVDGVDPCQDQDCGRFCESVADAVAKLLGVHKQALAALAEARKNARMTELSEPAKRSRVPLSPEELVGAKQDKVHVDVGKGRAAKTVRGKQDA
jgi:hypothetical protein